jgi:hypothetical protein
MSLGDDERRSVGNPKSRHGPPLAGALRWLAVGLLVLAAGTLILSRDSSLAATVQESSYFRLKIGLSHKGEPIDMDIVVGCGVRITQSRLTGVIAGHAAGHGGERCRAKDWPRSPSFTPRESNLNRDYTIGALLR